MAHWLRLSTLAGVSPAADRIVPLLDLARTAPLALPRAQAWHRLFARLFDLWSLGLLAEIGVTFAASHVWPAFESWRLQPLSQFVLLWLLCPAVLLIEATVYAAFGNTFGKALMGIVVVTGDGRRADAFEYLQRLVGVYWYGLGAAFPPVAAFTMAHQYKRLAAKGKASYDRGRFSVKAASRVGLGRSLTAAGAIVAVTVAVGTLGYAIDGYERGEQLAISTAR